MMREVWLKRRDRRPAVEWLIVIAIMLALPSLLRPAHGAMRPKQPSPSASASASASGAVTDLDGRLCAYVLSGAWEPASGKALDERRLPPDIQARVPQFRERTKQVRSRITRTSTTGDPERDGFFERQGTERALVALFDGPGIAAEAAAYAQRAPFSYEYEGHPDGPREEIAYTRAYLRRHPATRLAPYFWLLLAHRSRVLFEIFDERKHRDEQMAAAQAYRDAIQHARASDDPLIRAAAEDLDRQAFVYVAHPKGTSGPHPATYR